MKKKQRNNKMQVLKKRLINVFLLAALLAAVLLIINMFSFPVLAEQDAFKVDNVLLKLSIKQEDSVSKTIKITNTADSRQDFSISSDLDLVSFQDKEFSLDAGESKTIELQLTAQAEAGVYTGTLLISSNLQTIKIPIILEIETKEVLFDINLNIPPEYYNVQAGEQIIIETNVFNLENLGLKTIEMSYLVRDFQGNTIFSEQENLVVENNMLTTKIISLPENTEKGEYVLIVMAKYSDSVGTSSYFFRISKKRASNFVEENMQTIMILFIIIIIVVIAFVVYSIKQRDKLFLELQKQQKGQLNQHIEKVEAKKKTALKKAKKPSEKKKIRRRFERIKKVVARKVKKKHREQRREFKKLKKKKRKTEMQKKLQEWKKQGVNINEFVIQTSKIKPKDLQKQTKQFKKEGYKI